MRKRPPRVRPQPDPRAQTARVLQDIAGFMHSFQQLFGGYPAAEALAEINRDPWHSSIHYWRYDGRLCPDPLPETDGWGKPLAYRAVGPVVERHLPRYGIERRHTEKVRVAPDFEVRSAGPDGALGNDDDIILSAATLDAALRDVPERQIYGEWGLAQLYNLEWVVQGINGRNCGGPRPRTLAEMAGRVDADLAGIRYEPAAGGKSYTLTHGWRDGAFGTADDVVIEGGHIVRIPDAEIPRVLDQAHDACGPIVAARSMVHYFCDDFPDRMVALAANNKLTMRDRLLILEFLLGNDSTRPGAFQLFLASSNVEIRRAAAERLAITARAKQQTSREWKVERSCFDPLVEVARKLLRDPDPATAESAAFFIAVMLPDEAVAAARSASLPTLVILETMEVAAERKDVGEARAALVDPSFEVRLAAVRALGACGGAAEALRGLDDEDTLVRAQSLECAMKHPEEDLPEELVRRATGIATDIWQGQPELIAGLASLWMQRHAPEVWQGATPGSAISVTTSPTSSAVAPPPEETTAPPATSASVRAWDSRLEAGLVTRWRTLWSGPSDVALDGDHAAELADVLRALVLSGGDDAAIAIADTVDRLLSERHSSLIVAPLVRAIGLIGARPGQARLEKILASLDAASDAPLEDALLDALRRGGVADPAPVLAYVERTSDMTKRQQAAFALGTFRGREAVRQIRDRICDSDNAGVRGNLMISLARAGGQEALLTLPNVTFPEGSIGYLLAQPPHPALLHFLNSPQCGRSPEVIRALGHIEHPDAAWHLFRLLSEAAFVPSQLVPGTRVYDRRLQGLRAIECDGVSRVPQVDTADARASLARILPLIRERVLDATATPQAGRDLQLALMLPDLENGSVRLELTTRLLESPYAAVRLATMRSLEGAPSDQALGLLVRRTYDTDPAPRVRLLAARLLGKPFAQSGSQVRRLCAASAASNATSLTALPESGRDEDVASLVATLREPERIVAAADALALTLDGRATPALLESLGDRDDLEHGKGFAKACEALGQIGDPAAVPPLLAALKRIAPAGRTPGAQALVGALLRTETDKGALSRALWDVSTAVPEEAGPPEAGRSLREPIFWALVELGSKLVSDTARQRMRQELSGRGAMSESMAAWPDLVDYFADVEGAKSLESLLDGQMDAPIRERILVAIGNDPAVGCRALQLDTKAPWTVEWNVIGHNPSPLWLPCLERWLLPPQTPHYSGLAYLAKIGGARAAEILALTLANIPFDAEEARLPLDPLEPPDPYYDLPNKTYSSAARAAFLQVPLARRWIPWLAAHLKPGARLQAALLLDSLPADDTCGMAESLIADAEPLVRYAAITRLQPAALQELRPLLEKIAATDAALRVRRAASLRLVETR